MVTVSRTWCPAGQTHSADYVTSGPTKFPTASSTSASSTTTTTGGSTPTVYALSAEPLDLSSSRTILPCHIEIAGTRRSIYSTDHSRDEELRSPGRSSKRSRTASASAPRRSRRPFTVFPSKRAARSSLSPSANCKHYCHAFQRHGRKCLSPCARRRPGHYHCRCARHQRR